MDPMAAIKQTFFQECEEQLAELETGLLAMESGETDSEAVLKVTVIPVRNMPAATMATVITNTLKPLTTATTSTRARVTAGARIRARSPSSAEWSRSSDARC